MEIVLSSLALINWLLNDDQSSLFTEYRGQAVRRPGTELGDLSILLEHRKVP